MDVHTKATKPLLTTASKAILSLGAGAAVVTINNLRVLHLLSPAPSPWLQTDRLPAPLPRGLCRFCSLSREHVSTSVPWSLAHTEPLHSQAVVQMSPSHRDTLSHLHKLYHHQKLPKSLPCLLCSQHLMACISSGSCVYGFVNPASSPSPH